MSSYLTDQSIQSLTSAALFNLSFVHTIYYYSKDPLQLAESYPRIANDASGMTAYRKHLRFHLVIVLRVFLRTVVTVYVAFLVVLSIKLIVIDSTNAALERNTNLSLSVLDVHDLMTRSLWKDDGLFRLIKILLAQGITASIVATFLSDPGSMKIPSHRLINVQIILGSLMLVQLIVVAAMSL